MDRGANSHSSGGIVYARAGDFFDAESAAADSKDALGVHVALWKKAARGPSAELAGSLPGEGVEHSNARAVGLHSMLGLIEFHAREAAAECCEGAALQLAELARGSAPVTIGSLVQVAIVYTGGTPPDAAMLMAPLVSSLKAE